MLLRIDPTLALLWRSPEELQVGAPEAVARVRVSGEWELQVVELLRLGVSSTKLREAAAASREPDALPRLELVVASLERSFTVRRQAPLPRVRVQVPGDDPATAHIRRALAAMGYELAEPSAAEFTVLVGHYLIDPARYRPLLNTDRRHLAVLLDDAAVHVTPVIVPGQTGCLYCFERQRAANDPAWPTLAAQLLRRRARAADGYVLAASATEVARMITRYLSGAAPTERSVLTASGQRLSQPWQADQQCDCCWAAIPPKNVTALAHRAGPALTNSDSARRAHA